VPETSKCKRPVVFLRAKAATVLWRVLAIAFLSVCGYTCLYICRLNALLQQQQTDRPSGVANGPRLNCRFLLAIARRTLVAALMLQLS